MPRSVKLLMCMVVAALLAATSTAPARDEDDSFLADFVIGDYVLVGRAPDAGAAYSGSARISRVASTLRLEREVDGVVRVAEGAVEVPHPPGEGTVLRFRWREGDEVEVMTCLVDADLDNFARVTCVVVTEGRAHAEPGLEALFPTAAWPESAPSKQFHGGRAASE